MLDAARRKMTTAEPVHKINTIIQDTPSHPRSAADCRLRAQDRWAAGREGLGPNSPAQSRDTSRCFRVNIPPSLDPRCYRPSFDVTRGECKWRMAKHQRGIPYTSLRSTKHPKEASENCEKRPAGALPSYNHRNLPCGVSESETNFSLDLLYSRNFQYLRLKIEMQNSTTNSYQFFLYGPPLPANYLKYIR